MRELTCQRCGTQVNRGEGAPGCWCEDIPAAPNPSFSPPFERYGIARLPQREPPGPSLSL